MPAAPVDQKWARAAHQNVQLRNNLDWVFGGKTQHGWALYTPLIAHTLETEADADSADFAQALARWQRGAGLTGNGVLFGDTLYKLVEKWQSHRLKDHTYPTPDKLLTAPAADFYDPARPDDQRQVEKETYAAYKRMVAAAVADRSLGLSATRAGELAPGEKYLKIISAFRSRERQEQLRRQEPQAGRAALAVNSPHFTGRALDLYVGGEPVITKDANRALQTQTRAYRWLVHNAARFGFQPYYYEPWHWEYVGK
jgi:D-alanyl-D-alanine carboxypeptidase